MHRATVFAAKRVTGTKYDCAVLHELNDKPTVSTGMPLGSEPTVTSG